MTTSNSANFAISGAEICSAAYRIVYNVSSLYTLEAEEMADFMQALNLLVKNLMGPPNFLAKGIKTWQKEVASLALAAKIEYNLQPSGGDLDINIPVRVLNANYKHTPTSGETPLTEMTDENYFQLSSKIALGTPIAYNYHRALDSGLFRLNCIPSASVVANLDTIEIHYLTPLEDFDSNANTPYFPQEWYRPLKWFLAQEMMPEAGKSMPPEVAALATQSIEAATSVQEENSDMHFEPDNPENW